MNFAEILSEIPRLSFAERQEWVRSAIAMDDADIPLEELRGHVRLRLPVQ